MRPIDQSDQQVSDTLGNVASATASLGDFVVNLRSDELTLGAFNAEVAARDSATGTGYLMLSEEPVGVRFLSNPPHPDNASNLVAVLYQKQQQLELWSIATFAALQPVFQCLYDD